MRFTLPELPYAKDSLAPALSAETLDYHHDKHHQAYVDNLNKLVKNTSYEGLQSLEDIVTRAPQGPIFNNAAQAWNHAFYWNSIKPDGGGAPPAGLAETIEKTHNSLEALKEEFTAKALANFGSGWTWLVIRNGRLSVENTSNAGTPLAMGATPLLACDVWEHAYYIDYRNSRAKYLEAFWSIVNWDFAARNIQAAAVAR
ncbi:MAG: superoxide dismutase [Elusimicrobia bacterium]|nr:superoxide dismutase [Elusimicrobiota bacterium]